MIKEGSSAFGISISPASKVHKKVTLFSKKGHFHHKGAAGFRKYLWRHSLQSGTSAFHGSCRTSTAKLRSRVCPRGESVIRDRFQSWLSLFSFDFSSRSTSTMRKRETGNQSRSASALAFLSPRNTIGGIFDFTRFLKKVFKETLIQSLPACVSFLTDQR